MNKIMKPDEFQNLVDLASEALGGQVVSATDDFFASKDNLIKPGRGIFVEGKYTENGKWMDGWESRRKRDSGHDFCVIKLGVRGVIQGVDIDTNHFLGNHPPEASLEACYCESDVQRDLESCEWTEVLKKSPLEPGSHNLFAIASDSEWTHLRLHIYPDGGVARLKVYGEAKPDWNCYLKGDVLDLAAVENGGHVLKCNDMFFSSKDNLIMPGRGKDMGDGWETKRRRGPGHDWVIVRLGKSGIVKEIEVDTCHFKGNFPDRCSIEACRLDSFSDSQLEDAEWKELLSPSKLEAHKQHFFSELNEVGPVNCVRLNIFPDGGVSRLRVRGVVE